MFKVKVRWDFNMVTLISVVVVVVVIVIGRKRECHVKSVLLTLLVMLCLWILKVESALVTKGPSSSHLELSLTSCKGSCLDFLWILCFPLLRQQLPFLIYFKFLLLCFLLCTTAHSLCINLAFPFHPYSFLSSLLFPS